MSVNLAETEVFPYLETIPDLLETQKITIACINSPRNVTLSGSESDLDIVQHQLDIDQIFARKLQTGLAYHSPQMGQVTEEYKNLLQDLEPGKDSSPSRIPMVSSVTGEVITDIAVLATAQYWVNNMTQPVKFRQAISHVMLPIPKTTKKKLGGAKAPWNVYEIVEIGPHAALQRPVVETRDSLKLKHDVRYHSVLSRNRSSLQSTVEVAGKLWAVGYPIDLASINQPAQEQETKRITLTDLPEYPFDHSRRYWFENRLSKNTRFREHATNDLLGTPSSDWNPLEARWSKIFDKLSIPWVEDHKVRFVLLKMFRANINRSMAKYCIPPLECLSWS